MGKLSVALSSDNAPSHWDFSSRIRSERVLGDIIYVHTVVSIYLSDCNSKKAPSRTKALLGPNILLYIDVKFTKLALKLPRVHKPSFTTQVRELNCSSPSVRQSCVNFCVRCASNEAVSKPDCSILALCTRTIGSTATSSRWASPS
jgi:hypothetical protein